MAVVSSRYIVFFLEHVVVVLHLHTNVDVQDHIDAVHGLQGVSQQLQKIIMKQRLPCFWIGENDNLHGVVFVVPKCCLLGICYY
jgi:hypothetical protein